MSPTKTERLRSEVFSQILHGDYGPGDRLPTERAMAEMAGVSRVTVRRAYAALEQAGILKRLQGSGTVIATELHANTDQPELVALVSAQLDAFSVESVIAMEAELAKRGSLLVVRLTDSPEAEEQAILDIMAKDIHHLIIWPQRAGRLSELTRRLRVLGANMVFFDRILPGPGADFVGLDNVRAATQLVDHAVAAGCTRLAFVNHDEEMVDSNRERLVGFERRCRKHGIPYEIHVMPREGNRVPAARRLIETAYPWADGEPLGFVCANDSLARTVRSMCRPDSPVYGIDGVVEPHERIVTISQPLDRMAEKAVDLLFKQQGLGDRWTATQVRLRGTLVE